MKFEFVVKSMLLVMFGPVLIVAEGWRAVPWVGCAALLMAYVIRDSWKRHSPDNK